jgi:hypothetical protein
MAEPHDDKTVQRRQEPRPNTAEQQGLPDRIGRYRVERVLGEGGFGLVYLAHDDQLQRLVAIKVPHRERVAQPEDAEAYLTEARTVANLDHPNIVPVHDVGSTQEFPCFAVSKFIDGTDLAKKIKQSHLSLHEAVELVATVAEALHYAHKQGLVHRDIKPGNILLDRSGKPFVTDFGLAFQEEDVGKGPHYAGTPGYMSPEQARKEGHRVDGRSDIFSLGVVFYELLTGRRPFRGDTREELLEKITSVEARPPRQVDDTIPKELERICLKALAKRASERYTTAKDFADDLRYFMGQLGTLDGQADAKESLYKNSARRKRRRLLWGIVAGSVGITTAAMIMKIPPVLFLPENTLVPGVDVFHVRWVGGGARAFLDDQSLATAKGTKPLLKAKEKEYRGYSLALIIDPAVDDVCEFHGRACAFTFELQPKPGVPWVRVDGIDLIVQDYKALPKYNGIWPRPKERMHVYYVEIDKPGVGTDTFSASLFYENETKAGRFTGTTKRHDLEFVRLVEGKPEAFVVRVNAKTPGVYTFSARVRLSHKDTESRQTIVRSATFLFDKRN